MEWTVADDVFTTCLTSFTNLAGDARTQRLLGETERRIIGAEGLCYARVATFPPEFAATRGGNGAELEHPDGTSVDSTVC